MLELLSQLKIENLNLKKLNKISNFAEGPILARIIWTLPFDIWSPELSQRFSVRSSMVSTVSYCPEVLLPSQGQVATLLWANSSTIGPRRQTTRVTCSPSGGPVTGLSYWLSSPAGTSPGWPTVTPRMRLFPWSSTPAGRTAISSDQWEFKKIFYYFKTSLRLALTCSCSW